MKVEILKVSHIIKKQEIELRKLKRKDIIKMDRREKKEFGRMEKNMDCGLHGMKMDKRHLRKIIKMVEILLNQKDGTKMVRR